ncbi:hypothetical protein GF337_20735 [candidate division KSB1 bacterium]|nr:hypothetical protein [candidate division KSB1 bacterium]
MKKFFTRIILLFLMVPKIAQASEMYEYLNTTGDSKVRLKFQIAYQDNGIVYSFFRPDGTYIPNH